jgi:hypothetical protein
MGQVKINLSAIREHAAWNADPDIAELAGAAIALCALTESLPRCLGTWVSGSGGHKVWALDCLRIATRTDEIVNGGWGEPVCDKHFAMWDGLVREDYEETPWADVVRRLGL